ncbi:MAG TPA: amylo-alpha-1,6-glucosidase [Phycisphaerae bacterium]|nr:amylo-alpha-1,6-glucosidase [Phycisphaerae bacterium]
MSVDPLAIETGRCADLSVGRRLEWLVTNGRGGYAMAAVNQMLTRRYHGLLVAAVEPPVERFVLLAKLDTTATINGLTYELATNDYAEAVHPQGYRLLESFTPRPQPTWRWRVGDALIEQTLCMTAGEDTTWVRYVLVQGATPVALSVRPLCTSRHFHHLAHYQDVGPPTVEEDSDALRFHWANGRPPWQISHNGVFKSRPDWYYRFVLTAEAERGYDYLQDLFMPGVIGAVLQPGDTTGLMVVASTQAASWRNGGQAFTGAAARDKLAVGALPMTDPLVGPLARATADFIVSRGDDQKTVIAGYPWFGDWGRDTFISLPGLCLVTGRHDTAREILETFAQYVDGGMIPNRFPDFGQAPEYNTADAALWYIHALDRYVTYSGDTALADRMFPIVEKILAAHQQGTRHGIRADSDGLLAAGENGFALTWMDAMVSGQAVTPRIGKPVEISALWYNALSIAAGHAERLGKTGLAQSWRALAALARKSFNGKFWNAASGCLYDVVDVNGQADAADVSIRPNQLLAISLTHPILDEEKWSPVVGVCERLLWTPLGLRSLAPTDPAYRGRYAGGVAARDQAYHQGTVWPWLFGPFVTAYVRAHGGTAQAVSSARTMLDGLIHHFGEAGIGSVSEVADADAPHAPGGCPWQAWSVAEPLRALCEDVLGTHPQAMRREGSAAAPKPALTAAKPAAVERTVAP